VVGQADLDRLWRCKPLRGQLTPRRRRRRGLGQVLTGRDVCESGTNSGMRCQQWSCDGQRKCRREGRGCTECELGLAVRRRERRPNERVDVLERRSRQERLLDDRPVSKLDADFGLDEMAAAAVAGSANSFSRAAGAGERTSSHRRAGCVSRSRILLVRSTLSSLARLAMPARTDCASPGVRSYAESGRSAGEVEREAAR
jgi:hypothetical protein